MKRLIIFKVMCLVMASLAICATIMLWHGNIAPGMLTFIFTALLGIISSALVGPEARQYDNPKNVPYKG